MSQLGLQMHHGRHSASCATDQLHCNCICCVCTYFPGHSRLGGFVQAPEPSRSTEVTFSPAALPIRLCQRICGCGKLKALHWCECKGAAQAAGCCACCHEPVAVLLLLLCVQLDLQVQQQGACWCVRACKRLAQFRPIQQHSFVTTGTNQRPSPAPVMRLCVAKDAGGGCVTQPVRPALNLNTSVADSQQAQRSSRMRCNLCHRQHTPAVLRNHTGVPYS